jgi:heme A synthase
VLLLTRRPGNKRRALLLMGTVIGLGALMIALRYTLPWFISTEHVIVGMSVLFLWLSVVLLTGYMRLAVLLLGLVIAQGALGALTVKFKLPWFISTAHLLLGMSYFATLIYTVFRTRPEPSVVELQRHENQRIELGNARTWIAIACSAVFIQLLLGALVRHLGAAMVCLGMPSCTMGGDWWPDAGVQHLHMIHRGFGVVVAIVTTIAAVVVARRVRSWPSLRLLALVAPLLVIGQVVLGILTVMSMRAVPLAVGHFAGAASLWALWMSAWLMTGRRIAGASAYDDEIPSLRSVAVMQ